MPYHSLRECVDDLHKHKMLVQIDAPVSPYLEAAAIHRRVFAAGGPALLFANVEGCRFPMASNLFGTFERAKFIFRDTYASVQRLIDLKIDATRALKAPLKYWRAPFSALSMLPRYVRGGPVMRNRARLADLPQLVCWPRDGGPFVTLPQVYTEDPYSPGLKRSNLGMYRIQLAGNEYADDEMGLHYQIHRSIGVHQQAAMAAGVPFRVNVFVGGPPAMSLAAVMPLPEGMSELTFAGALAGRRVRMVRRPDGLPVHADTDFAICGTVVPGKMLPEGPFGDHLGYYSLQHPFPVLKVEAVLHRDDAVWPFTVVGRPPQEDTMFGALIHDLTGPVIPTVLPGVKEVHAVDAAGVHPLLLAIGSERYMPFLGEPRPQEILTQASAILGQGQLSLAKFLWIANSGDDPSLDLHNIEKFFSHMLARVDWGRDLHFHTETTIDTLDYTGTGLNAGSKVVVAAAGPVRYELATKIPGELALPGAYRNPRVVFPGVMVVEGPPCPAPSFDYDAVRRGNQHGDQMEQQALDEAQSQSQQQLRAFCNFFDRHHALGRFRMVVLVDDSDFVAQSLSHFLWVTFTRANPAADIDGIEAFTRDKHWGCAGPLVIDARVKPHHAPILEEDPEVTKRIEAMAAGGGPLAGLL